MSNCRVELGSEFRASWEVKGLMRRFLDSKRCVPFLGEQRGTLVRDFVR